MTVSKFFKSSRNVRSYLIATEFHTIKFLRLIIKIITQSIIPTELDTNRYIKIFGRSRVEHILMWELINSIL